MISGLTNLWISFAAGLLAPLTAVCVLPLYPGFLAYLSNRLTGKESKRSVMYLGVVAGLGVISSMLLIGLIFSFLLQESLTKVIGIISPIAFGILFVVSILLIFNIDFARIFPQIKAPKAKNPYWSSYGFGFFFGAIVLPCNPASLVVLFAISTTTVSFLLNLVNFMLFGIGMALPLVIFAVISGARSRQVIGFLTRNKKTINIITGLIMLVISIYYLVFVFSIFG